MWGIVFQLIGVFFFLNIRYLSSSIFNEKSSQSHFFKIITNYGQSDFFLEN